MSPSKAVAVAVAVAIPFFAVLVGLAIPSETPRLTLLSCVPLILIFKPRFVTDYLGKGFIPTLLGWIAFGSIAAQIFLAPFLLN